MPPKVTDPKAASLLDARALHAAEAARKRVIARRRLEPPIKVPLGLVVCGVDEAGRGPLAGPVYAAAVVLPPGKLPASLGGLGDSKTLSEKARARLYVAIQTEAVSFAIASASVQEIDRLNILQASLLAMQRAVEKIMVTPDEVWVDGNRCPTLRFVTRAVVKGDARVAAISAASILAKEARDKELRKLDLEYPQYALAQHKGYPTALHLARLKEYGPAVIHRLTFGPVKRAIEQAKLQHAAHPAPTTPVTENLL